MPNVKNIKPPTEERKHGIIYRFELLEEKKQAKIALQKAKEMCRPVWELVKDTHTGEITKRLAHA